ncbi:hypothetical protein [Klebsiella variicola]|jgi:hypothetical protein|uniref:hypothetical protein n=1 Tax=Klebsiella variicola TaxID=244366 RepID=UPI002B053422|nr:hypothetical protein [Klebsiella variicola]
MLVYINSFNCIGDDSFFSVIRSVSGWLNKVAKIRISPEDLLSRRDWNLERVYVRTYTAEKIEPKIYSIMYTHPDRNVGGRQWITEIGIKREGVSTFVSILLEISDVSTMVDARPIATRPSLVSYLKKNCTFDHDVIGQRVDYIKSQYGDFQYLKHEISRDDRVYPLVFISEGDGGFPVVPEKLQEQLIGLAQVVATSGEMDSWEMERLLGRSYSSWGGAINIIYPMNQTGYIGTKLFLPKQLDEVAASTTPINNYILSVITHSLNGFNKKRHLSPANVRAKRLSDDNVAFRQRMKDLKEGMQYEELLDTALLEFEEFKSANQELELDYLKTIEELDGKYDALLTEKNKIETELNRLKFEAKNFHRQATTQNPDIDIDRLISLVGNKLTPESVLLLLEMLIPNNVEILKSAIRSAQDSVDFRHGPRLVFLLYKLCTSYLIEYLENGDNTAKEFLGDAYSANESETVERSATLSKMREFDYDGKKVKMFQHVRIGTARAKNETIRVHFLVDKDKRKIIIGYCGEHLDVKST